MNGKGDTPRPVDRRKYERNFDMIAWRGMLCPKCGRHNLRVAYVRHSGGGTRRVRRCANCGRRFPTVETPIGTQKSTPVYSP